MRKNIRTVLIFTVIGTLVVFLLGLIFAVFGGMSNSSGLLEPAFHAFSEPDTFISFTETGLKNMF